MNEAMTTAMSTAFTDIASDITGTIVVGLPIALGVYGAILAIKAGIKFYGNIVKKS